MFTFKESVEPYEEELYRGETVVTLSSQRAPPQQGESEAEGDHLAVFSFNYSNSITKLPTKIFHIS